MKKIVVLFIFSLLFLGFSVVAQDIATDQTNMGGGETIDLPPNGNDFGSDTDNQSAEEFAEEIYDEIAQQKIEDACVADGGIYSTGSIPCLLTVEACSNAFAGDAEGDAACRESHQKCVDGGGTPDRCACKAIGGISLNTNVPFVGNCISMHKSSNPNTTQVTPDTAFPRLIMGLTKIVMTVILIFCFLAIIVGGVMMSAGGADEGQYTKGKDLIKHVAIALALLGASGVILRIINPSFFM